ncbi:hypothetical protein BJ508DRAFT_328914 [Ascobolus immersus RN42]|uniref:Rho-GAP domain-containing protein n=1 Tax=Ascobolus immersus RN42 TaxID=1160509 RepID=A0A3N4HZW6_ASCIM|nr:hypothetical protein BJ508DRAFT_328914 [Ascobolus immersus RN42]
MADSAARLKTKRSKGAGLAEPFESMTFHVPSKYRARPSLAALPDSGYRTRSQRDLKTNLKSSPSRYTLSEGREQVNVEVACGREGGGGGCYYMDGPYENQEIYGTMPPLQPSNRKLVRPESTNRLRKKAAARKKVSIPGLNEEFIAMSMRQKGKRDSGSSTENTSPIDYIGMSRSTLTGTYSAASTRESYTRTPSRLTLNDNKRTASRLTLTESRTETSSDFTTSNLTNILFTEPPKPSLTKTNHPTTKFVEEFNVLAKKHGLQPMPTTFQAEPYQQSVSSAPSEKSDENILPDQSRSRKFLSRFLKRSTSLKAKANPKVVEFKNRRVSMGDITAIGKGKKDTLKGMHLEDIIRLGGVCEFVLPKKYTPGRLFVPTCFHAAGTYIYNNGMSAPGLFKATGNPVVVWSLYDYYQRQLVDSKGVYEQGVTLAALPTKLQYSVNDVATLLKKLISGIPGGLLGSTAVFHALYNVHTFLFTPDLTLEELSKLKSRMIALAISSLNLHFRLSMICQVFGLLKAITDATEPTNRKNQILNQAETFTLLKDDSFAVAFAPLLLGDKYNNVIIKDPSEDRGGLQVLPSVTPTAAHKGSNSSRKSAHGLFKRNTAVEDAAKLEEEKLRRCALVVNMMLEEWEGIVKELRKLDSLRITAKEYIVPGFEPEMLDREDSPEPVEQDTIRARSRANSFHRDRDAALRDTPEDRANGTRSRAYSDVRDARKSMDTPMGRARAKSTNQMLANEEDAQRPAGGFRGPTRGKQTRFEDTPPEREQLIVVEHKTPPDNDRLRRKRSSPSPNYVLFDDASSTDGSIDEPLLRTPPFGNINKTTTIRPVHSPIYSPNYQLLEDELLGEPFVFREAEKIVFEKAQTPQTKIVHIQPGQTTPPGAKQMFQIHEDGPGGPAELDQFPEPTHRRPVPNSKSSSHLSSKSRASLKSRASQLSINTATSSVLKRSIARPLPTPPIRSPEKKKSERVLQPAPAKSINRTPSRLESFLADTNPQGQHQSTPIKPSSSSTTPSKSIVSSSSKLPEPPTSPTALYAEVLRLQSLVDAKTREADAVRTELELARNLAKTGVLQMAVKEEREEKKVWMHRAGWARGVMEGGAFTVPEIRQTGTPRAGGGLMPPLMEQRSVLERPRPVAGRAGWA